MFNKKIITILGACGNKSTTSANSKQQMTVAVIDDMTTLNAAKYSDLVSLEAIQNSYEGLYCFDQKGKPVLAGATKVSTNTDKTVYTFDLRKDAKWSNGDPVTAQDYVYAWKKLADPKTASPNSQRIDSIKTSC
ncbi:oligopeptide ABC superfamily ATP binding cassette transporter, binding protein [Ligilactobacillus hayakitensis DSM 18933 = JCM 14209]|uniref:Oligopeptide ABC superfamily ATP binding cassette transporter, binding protein n=1 Tax=Ligilactobacillus hayakitensis DSM 18933 = JCM 14209 TaxID=1423755 RepID=A0A0R1WQN7_9LACO|nr:oligopeptide ABC superfamily ATP binding cassette transporter, binding protein [Ligilactobacillus hayakitensis DSM 18933 = JCM 14209]